MIITKQTRLGIDTARAACLVRGLVAVLFSAALASTPQAGVRAPLSGLGDFEFTADLPTQPAADGRSRVDLVVRLDHLEARPAAAPKRWQRRVAVALKIAREGLAAVDTLQVFEVRGGGGEAADASTIAFDLLELSAAIGPGRWAVTVNCTLLGEDARSSRATGVLEVPVRADVGPHMGDPEFRIRSAGVSLPHPQRLYGVTQDTLEVYYELMAMGATQRVGVEFSVRDPIHGGMDEQVVWSEIPGGRSGHLFRLPLGSFPEGAYELGLRLAHPVPSEPQLASAEFVVSWRLERAMQSSDDVLVEAALVLPSEELERFRRLSRAAQSQRMQEFWDQHDPTPGTAVNELHERFKARVAQAWRAYGEAGTPGPLTARGRTFVRYGEPLEVQVQVLPANGADLDEAIERVHDTFTIPLEGVIAREQENRASIVGLQRPGRSTSQEVLRDRLRNQARVGKEGSFELWVYRGSGDPLFADALGWGGSIDLRFLFVDRMGVGEYDLDFSNLPNRHE